MKILNIYKIIYPFLILIGILFQTLSCNSNEPNNNGNKPGSRNYVWNIDTLQTGSIQTNMVSMWGSSSEDVWLCGYDADNTKCIYHFMGERWTIVSNPSTNYIKKFYNVEGNSSNNIFFVGKANYYSPGTPPSFTDSAYVLQYLNGNWIVHNIPNSSTLYTLCWANEIEVWTGGAKGNLFKYNGNIWKKYFLGNEKLLLNNLVSINPNDVYATGHIEHALIGGGYYIADYLYQYEGADWTLIDSNITSTIYNRISFPTLMKKIDGIIFGSGDVGFVKKNGNSWIKIRSGIYGQFNGTNENNIFLANQDFGVMHYNGIDWYTFEQLPKLSYYDVEVFDNAVFLLATDGVRTYIVSGNLKQL